MRARISRLVALSAWPMSLCSVTGCGVTPADSTAKSSDKLHDGVVLSFEGRVYSVHVRYIKTRQGRKVNSFTINTADPDDRIDPVRVEIETNEWRAITMVPTNPRPFCGKMTERFRATSRLPYPSFSLGKSLIKTSDGGFISCEGDLPTCTVNQGYQNANIFMLVDRENICSYQSYKDQSKRLAVLLFKKYGD